MASLKYWQFFYYGSFQIMAAVNCLKLLILIYFDSTEIVEEEAAAPVEEGYNYPVPTNPLELPEKSSQSELPDDSVAPLALYGAPAQPFELPPGKQTTLKNLTYSIMIGQIGKLEPKNYQKLKEAHKYEMIEKKSEP